MSIDVNKFADILSGEVIKMAFRYLIDRTLKNPESRFYYKKIILKARIVLMTLSILGILLLLVKAKLSNNTKIGLAMVLFFGLGLAYYFSYSKKENKSKA